MLISLASRNLAILATVIVVNMPTAVVAQSRLPQCPSKTDVPWTNCAGTRTYPNGDKYIGGFKDDMPNGKGTYTYVKGIKYVGEFKEVEPDGQGTWTYPNGDKYVGE